MIGLPLSEKESMTYTDSSSLPAPISAASTTKSTFASSVFKAVRLGVCLYATYLLANQAHQLTYGTTLAHRFELGSEQGVKSEAACAQFPARAPVADAKLDANEAKVFSPEYRLESVKLHSGMVKIPSESYDDSGPVSGPDRDTRWDTFIDLHKYLKESFPLVHQTLKLDKVNEYGLVYTWEGSDPSLKPTMLMAHQDVVPVNPSTIDQWSYPPYSGHYDGEFIWGRGAGDCKSMLSGELEAIELLIAGGFKPTRTVLVASGFDEESKGWEGAGHIATYLEDKYGKNSMGLILDEGGLGIQNIYGRTIALPGTGEKGYLDVNMTLHTPGGHSSIPPPHTGVGIISEIVYTLEQEPYPITLGLANPVFGLLQCAAEHGDIGKALAAEVKLGAGDNKLAQAARDRVAAEFAKQGRPQEYLVKTSQAVDIVGGGVKINALPELVYAVANHRVSVDGQVSDVTAKLERLITPIAKKHGLDVDFFGRHVQADASAPSDSKLKLQAINALEPAPITPTGTAAWEVLSSAIQGVYAKNGEPIIVSPAIMTGNTDTRFMWRLSNNIYRFSPRKDVKGKSGGGGIHTVDEHASVDDHIAGVWFFHQFIRLADSADL